MAYLTKTEDRRYQLVRYRVRYRIYFPDGSWVARSRRYETLAIGRVKVELASALESRTRQLQQSPEDIKIWKNEGLLNAQGGAPGPRSGAPAKNAAAGHG